MSPPKISVIVPTWNGSKTIAACIKSLFNQSSRPAEIIVVDNASTDSTARIVSRFKQVKLVKLAINTGVVGGRNAGIRTASPGSDYLFFFDHDMVADRNMIKHLLDTSRKQNAGITTPKIYYLHDKNHIWAAGTGINVFTGQVLFRNGQDIGQFDKNEPVQVAPAAILVRREVIGKIGGFDPLFVSSWEDADFCFRAKKAGFSTYYSPQAIAFHDIEFDPRADARRLLGRYGFYIGQNRILFMKRFGKNFRLFLLVFMPVYLIYYLYLALRYRQITKYANYLSGTWSGFKLAHSIAFLSP